MISLTIKYQVLTGSPNREGVKKWEKAVRLTACEEAEKCIFNVYIYKVRIGRFFKVNHREGGKGGSVVFSVAFSQF